MQYKLLNLYKFLDKIADSLIGAFIPLIVLRAGGSVSLALTYLVILCVSRIASDYIINRQIQTKPEACLCMRAITTAIYCGGIFLLDVNIIVGLVVAGIFRGIDGGISFLAKEYLLNYSSKKSDSKAIGLTRLVEQVGVLAGLLVGGLLLDINRYICVSIALTLQVLASIPLLYYRSKNRHSKTLNKELVSTTTMQLSKSSGNSGIIKYTITTILGCYFIAYFSFAPIDMLANMHNLQSFISGSATFTLASTYILTYNLAMGISNIFVPKVEEKYDLVMWVRYLLFGIAIAIICLGLINWTGMGYVVFAIIGIAYPYVSNFTLQRLLSKTRIMGASNEGMFIREISSMTSYLAIYLTLLVFAIFQVNIVPYFYICPICLILGGIFIPKLEETSRKTLVDFIENNERE